MNTPPTKEELLGSIPDDDAPFYGDDDAPFFAPDGTCAGATPPSPGTSSD